MHETSDSSSRDALESSLQRDFAAGATWPIGRAAMAALIDMGLADDAIARYFAVTPAAVVALRQLYGLADDRRLSSGALALSRRLPSRLIGLAAVAKLLVQRSLSPGQLLRHMNRDPQEHVALDAGSKMGKPLEVAA